MSNETYELLHIDENYDIPRALILVLQNGRPSCLYQIDCYGYELSPFVFSGAEGDSKDTTVSSENITLTQASQDVINGGSL